MLECCAYLTITGLAGKYRWWELPVVFTGISRPGKYYQFPLKWEILGNTKIKFYFFQFIQCKNMF